MSIVKSEDMLSATGPGVDAFSYHFYGGVSKRCQGKISADEALSEEWLGRTERDEAFYAALRDRFEPGKKIWLTETGEAACGGRSFCFYLYRQLSLFGAIGAACEARECKWWRTTRWRRAITG